MSEKIYNLKREFNWRGDIAELLAKYQCNAMRTKGYEFKHNPTLSSVQNGFLKKFWSCIDLYRCDDFRKLTVFEVKARSFGVKRRPDITTSSLEAYQEALARGIAVQLIFVIFRDDWNVSFWAEEFDVSRFRVNNGGWYREKIGE